MKKLRSAYRLVAVAISTVGHFSFWRLSRLFIGFSHDRQLRWRNTCVRSWGRSMGAISGMRVIVDGEPPKAPYFLVANHLSYIDIVAFTIATDCVFIAKSEIEGWPGMGYIAKRIGTIFIERTNYQDLPRVISLIEENLAAGRGIIVFPEGTSGRGDKVLPFSSALMEPAARLGIPVSHASITYRTPEDELPAEHAVCWWGDMTLLPHLMQLLKIPHFDAGIRFGDEPISDADRKSLTRRLWKSVSESFVPVGPQAETFLSSLVAQRLNGVEPRGAHGRPESTK